MIAGELAECQWISLAFSRKDAGLKYFGRIVITHFDLLLQDDRPVVVFVIHEMNRASRGPFTGGENRLMHAQSVHSFAAKCGQ